jgi:AcrR family transcriptional regulator
LTADAAPTRPNAAENLKQIALEEFASVGYLGTSLQHIADRAGVSKSSILYHFASKEALLEDVLTPAIDAIESLLELTTQQLRSSEGRDEFIAAFVDCLLAYRLEVHIFINQGQSLVDVPVVHRVNSILQELAVGVTATIPSEEQRVRFGVALGGAAYILVASLLWSGTSPTPVDETRAALITVITELLTPVSASLPA